MNKVVKAVKDWEHFDDVKSIASFVVFFVCVYGLFKLLFYIVGQ